MENPEKKRLEFPRVGTKCPQCGCEERIGQRKIAELIEDGILKEGMFPKGQAWTIPLIDQSKPIVVSPLDIQKPRIPVLNVYWDVCVDCLHVYTTEVDFIMQEIQLPPQPMSQGRMPPPGMGRMPKFGPFGMG